MLITGRIVRAGGRIWKVHAVYSKLGLVKLSRDYRRKGSSNPVSRLLSGPDYTMVFRIKDVTPVPGYHATGVYK